MVKMAFIAPALAMFFMVSFINPILQSQGIDAFAKGRSQMAYVEHRINRVLEWEPNIKWNFWR